MSSLTLFKPFVVACAFFVWCITGFVNIANGFQILSEAEYEFLWIQKQKDTFKITNNKEKIAKFDLALKESVFSDDKRKSVCPGPRLNLIEMEANQMGTLCYAICKVASIVDEQNVILKAGEVEFWLSRYDTKDLTDDREVTVIDPVKVLEPKSFTTVLGAKRTIKAVELIGEEEYGPFLKVFLKDQADREYDSLTLKNGITIRAKILSIDEKKNKITFKLDDDSEKQFGVSAFSKTSVEKLKKKILDFKEKNKLK